MFATCFVFFHEVGHLNQQHRKLRNEMGYQTFEDHYAEMNSDQNVCVGEEALLRQTLELAADYEGIRHIVELVIALSGPAENPTDDPAHLLWAAVTAITLVFHVFQGPRELYDPLPPQGRHPQPTARMISLISTVADYVHRKPQLFRTQSKDQFFATIEGAVIAASQFWSTRAAREGGRQLPKLHEGLQDREFFDDWDREIMRVWNKIVPVLNEQQVCKNVKLPLRNF